MEKMLAEMRGILYTILFLVIAMLFIVGVVALNK